MVGRREALEEAAVARKVLRRKKLMHYESFAQVPTSKPAAKQKGAKSKDT